MPAKTERVSVTLRDVTFHTPGRDPAGDAYRPRKKPTARYANMAHPDTGAQIRLILEPTQEEIAAYHLHELQRITGRTYAEQGYLHEARA